MRRATPPEITGTDEELPTVCLAPEAVPLALRDADATVDVVPSEVQKAALPFAPTAEPEPQTLDGSICVAGPVLPFVSANGDARASVVHVARVAASVANLGPRAIAHAGYREASWLPIADACSRELADEAERGAHALRDAYDQAFLDGRAAHRGAFGRSAYVGLRTELERGVAVTADLGLDIADAMRFRRLARA